MRGSYRRKRGGDAPPERLVFRPLTAAGVIRLIARQALVDARLLPTDRHMQRWAVSQGLGLPVGPEFAEALTRTRLSALPDDEAIVTDQIVLRAPYSWRHFVFSWYRSPKPRELIAVELHIPVSAIGAEHQLVLAYLCGCLVGAGIPLDKSVTEFA